MEDFIDIFDSSLTSPWRIPDMSIHVVNHIFLIRSITNSATEILMTKSHLNTHQLVKNNIPLEFAVTLSQ